MEFGLKNIERLVRYFSHEVKNPLTTIKGYAQLLAVKADDRAFVDKTKSMIIENVDEIDGKINRMYDLFNSREARTDSIDMRAIIEECIAAPDLPCGKESIAMDSEVAQALARGDGDFFRRIIGALLYGFDWNNNPTTLRISLASEPGGHYLLGFSFAGVDFSDLPSECFYYPFAAKKTFLTGLELFEAFYLSSKCGWVFSLGTADGRSDFTLLV
jgi:hypothetical protein